MDLDQLYDELCEFSAARDLLKTFSIVIDSKNQQIVIKPIRPDEDASRVSPDARPAYNVEIMKEPKRKIPKPFDQSQKPHGLSCEKCGKSFTSDALLRFHERSHVGNKPFKCEKCEYASATKNLLKSHTKTAHPVDKIHCDKCSLDFENKKEFWKHGFSCISSGKCLHCGIVFQALKKHTTTMWKKCCGCGLSFDTKNELVEHQAKATTCSSCDLKFCHENELLTHVKLVHKKRDTAPDNTRSNITVAVENPSRYKYQKGGGKSTMPPHAHHAARSVRLPPNPVTVSPSQYHNLYQSAGEDNAEDNPWYLHLLSQSHF